MASTTPFKFKKEKPSVNEDTVSGVIKKRFKTEKKPTKFTWKGLYNLSALFETNMFSPRKMERIKDLKEGNAKAQEKDYIDFFEDIEKAGYSAADKLGYAIQDLATAGIDLGAKLIGKEPRLSEKLRDVYEENKMAEPETLTGKVVEVLAQYGVPSTGAFKIANRLRKFSLVQKSKAALTTTLGATASNIASKSGYMATAFGITDLIATEPGRRRCHWGCL